MNFDLAIDALKNGRQVRRKDWKDEHLRMDIARSVGNHIISYVTLVNDKGEGQAWATRTEDIKAEDWEVI